MSESQRHRLLASERRRVVLEELAERTAPVVLEELAAAVAAHGQSRTSTGRKVERNAVVLHHQHLPKLTEAGVVHYDPVTRRVESWCAPEDILNP